MLHEAGIAAFILVGLAALNSLAAYLDWRLKRGD